MAKAQRKLTKQMVEVTENSVVLTLSLAESELLSRLLMRVGGNPEGQRKHFNSIQSALWDAGVRPADNCDHWYSNKGTGCRCAIYLD